MASRRSKLIVIVVMALGLGVGALGAWWVVKARPQPGAIIDALAIPGGAVVIRHERSSDRAMIELYDGEHLRWRAMVPHYAGNATTPALAASPRSVIVRTVRSGRPYVFAFDTAGGTKLDSFDLLGDVAGDPAAYTLPGVATVSSGAGHAAEVVADPAGPGAVVIGVELEERRQAWKTVIPWRPTAAWYEGDLLVLDAGPGRRTALAVATGVAAPAPATPVPAADPPPHHVVGTQRLVVTPRSITVTDTATGAVLATIR